MRGRRRQSQLETERGDGLAPRPALIPQSERAGPRALSDDVLRTTMKEIMLLVHRLPFPPDKGDKIRSYHLLKHLLRDYKVHLGCFYDDVNDERYIDEVKEMCASSRILYLSPGKARLRSIQGFFSGAALSVPYYYRRQMSDWVDSTLENSDIDAIVNYSSPMGQYVLGSSYRRYARVMDFVDVDSDKWRQYSASRRWPMSWVYGREAKRLLEFDRSVAREFDAGVFVTLNEVDLFSKLAPESSGKIHAVENGVATDFFNPALDFSNPFSAAAMPIVFTGAMDYWANVDAVTWFAKEVFPGVVGKCPAAEFWIVGSSPTPEVQELTALPGVRVTGRVADVRPYLRFASASVAPLRIARGIQNKVLEALAMGCRVVCTSHALAGLERIEPMPLSVADSTEDFERETIRCVSANDGTSGQPGAREYAVGRYGWDEKLSQFKRLVEDVAR